MKKYNIIKKAVNGIKMSEEQKFRIIKACNESGRCNAPIRRGNKGVLAAAVCVILLFAMTFTAIATRQYLKNDTKNSPHVPKEAITENSSITEDSQGKGYLVACNGVAGDGQPIYFDITLRKKDKSAVLKTDEGVSVIRVRATDSILEFDDGHQKEVYYLLIEDSSDDQYHLEGQALLYDDEKQYLGQEVKLYIGEITADLSDGRSVEICRFDDPIAITVSADSDMRTVCFDKGEFVILGGGFEFSSIDITASSVTLYGVCSVEGPIYELEEIMDDAYIICNGELTPLGSKHGGGTTQDGISTISWLNTTIIDPETVTSICIDGKSINLG